MSFNTPAVAAALKTLMEGLSGMGVVQIGTPASVGPQVCGYITMGSQDVSRKTTGTTRRNGRFFCMMAYRVDEAETTAETTLMGLVDAFMAAHAADLTLGGACESSEVSTAAADDPEYRHWAGKEYREFPLLVTAVQDGTYEVNP